MDFDSNCYRASLISFSVLHFLSVGGLLTLIVLRGLDSYFINDLVPEQYTPVMYALTTGTILSIVASFVGWFASGLSRVRGSVVYLVLLVLSAGAMTYASLNSLTATLKPDSIKPSLDTKLRDMITFKFTTNDAIADLVDGLQKKHSCCGIDSFEDWQDSEWSKQTRTLKIPESCCQRPEPGCNRSSHPSNIWAIQGTQPLGCLNKLIDFHTERFFWIYTLGFAATFLTVIQVILTCAFCRTLRSDKAL